MGWKQVTILLISIAVIGTLITYMFFPFVPIDFNFSTNSNFSKGGVEEEMQFYPNMRFPSKFISYTIAEKCTLQKKGEMEEAFNIIENLTLLDFFDSKNGDIKILCEDKNRISDDGLFIAGEGGPVNVTLGSKFNVILKGEIVLIRNSDCERPNIAIHELLHVLGFDHSDNPNNIMYPISKCKQTIGEDIINKLNELYSVPSLPDLEFDSASANMKGRSLNLNFSVRNEGLKDSEDFEVVIYGDGKEIKRFYSDELKIGYGQKVELTNQIVSQIKINKMKFIIEADFEELNKSNNEIILEITS